MTLLSEADRADGVAVALALCFAAIEAVVCEKPKTEKDWGIEKQIMKYVPALLRPNPIGRTNRGNVLYDLYYTRCNVIHGSRPVADLLECHDVRQIAAGVLRAAAQWRIARRSQGESPSWECFIGELNEAFVSKCALRDTPDLSDLLPSEQRRRQYQRDNDAIA